MKNKTLIIGASTNPDRYSYMALKSLKNHGHEILAIGNKKGEVEGIQWSTEWNSDWKDQVDTVTLYVNPRNQEAYLQKIIDLQPRRVIFNPGTENQAFIDTLKQHDIEPVIACTLVMLSIGNY